MQFLLRQQPVFSHLLVTGNSTWPGKMCFFNYLVSLLLLSRLFFSKMLTVLSKFFDAQVFVKEIWHPVMFSLVFAETKKVSWTHFCRLEYLSSSAFSYNT